MDLYPEMLQPTSNTVCTIREKVREDPSGHYLTDTSNINIGNARNSRVTIAAVLAIGMKVLKK